MADLTPNLDKAYTELRLAVNDLFLAQEANLLAKTSLEDAQRAILVANADDPKKLGSNEAARQAKLDELCSSELEIARTAAAAVREKQHALELARIEVERFRNMKHLSAISAGVSLN